MKKLIMALAVVATAMMVQASSVSWKVTTGNGSLTVYGFANQTAASILSACASSDSADWTAAFASAVKGTNSGSGTRVAAEGITDGIAANDTLVFVALDGAVAEGTAYTVYTALNIPAANVYEPPASGSLWQLKTADMTAAGTGVFSESVPEPTSGLLLLLGVAGLALRRRRA